MGHANIYIKTTYINQLNVAQFALNNVFSIHFYLLKKFFHMNNTNASQ